jgi:hypothetical protein
MCTAKLSDLVIHYVVPSRVGISSTISPVCGINSGYDGIFYSSAFCQLLKGFLCLPERVTA